jgi:hypothetical protein
LSLTHTHMFLFAANKKIWEHLSIRHDGMTRFVNFWWKMRLPFNEDERKVTAIAIFDSTMHLEGGSRHAFPFAASPDHHKSGYGVLQKSQQQVSRLDIYTAFATTNLWSSCVSNTAVARTDDSRPAEPATPCLLPSASLCRKGKTVSAWGEKRLITRRQGMSSPTPFPSGWPSRVGGDTGRWQGRRRRMKLHPWACRCMQAKD